MSSSWLTFSWFLVETFRERINNRLKYAMTVILSVRYALISTVSICCRWFFCIFTGFWFVFEYARNLRHQETLVEQLVDLVKKVVSYVAAMLVGIMPGSDNQGAAG